MHKKHDVSKHEVEVMIKKSEKEDVKHDKKMMAEHVKKMHNRRHKEHR